MINADGRQNEQRQKNQRLKASHTNADKDREYIMLLGDSLYDQRIPLYRLISIIGSVPYDIK
ncbi:hypothetical protein B6A27_14170 [Anoxybacillus sp. UARK-01]|nr:hypothetical protein B6A27_14170 [Anoxybacillus sp. UARK-01]